MIFCKEEEKIMIINVKVLCTQLNNMLSIYNVS